MRNAVFERFISLLFRLSLVRYRKARLILDHKMLPETKKGWGGGLEIKLGESEGGSWERCLRDGFVHYVCNHLR